MTDPKSWQGKTIFYTYLPSILIRNFPYMTKKNWENEVYVESSKWARVNASQEILVVVPQTKSKRCIMLKHMIGQYIRSTVLASYPKRFSYAHCPHGLDGCVFSYSCWRSLSHHNVFVGDTWRLQASKTYGLFWAISSWWIWFWGT